MPVARDRPQRPATRERDGDGAPAPDHAATRAAAGPLAGRRALVTGGSRGIGFAVARALADAGATLSLIARDRDALDRAAADLGAEAAEPADVTDADALAAAIGRLGPVDILVNNAGGAESAPFARTGVADLRRALDLNLVSGFAATQAVLPGMLARGYGRVVFVASTAGLKGYPYVSAYCAAKHAVVGLTRALALELARTPVTVNAVCPGFTDTPMLARSVETIEKKTGLTAAAARERLAGANPQGRLIQPDEVASAVLFLCQDAAASITGQALAISGGEV